MTEADVWGRVVEWIALRSGVPAIKHYPEGGTRRDQPYIGCHVQSAGPRNQQRMRLVQTLPADWDTNPDAKASVYPLIPWEWNFSLNCYAAEGDPVAPLQRIQSAIKINQMREPLAPDLIPDETSLIRRLRESINQRWENRAQMDLIVLGSMRETFEIDVFTETEPPIIEPKE